MKTPSLDTFEKAGLDSPKMDLSEKLSSLHDGFETKVEPVNGYFGYLAAKAADSLPQWTQNMLDRIHSPEEARIYKNAGLKSEILNGKEVMVREISPHLVDADGFSNMQRMERGLSPIDANEKTIELHHVGQKADSPLAELSANDHRGKPNDTVLHDKSKPSEIDRPTFDKERKEHWKARAEDLKREMSFKGRMTAANEAGVKSGLIAAGLTAAISTVDNIRGVMNGELSPQEAFVGVAKDTGTAGAIGYGVGFVSTAVAKTMEYSSNALFRSLGKAGAPAAVIAFGIQSCDSVVNFAQGNISGEKLAIKLGENATGVLGSMAGAALSGAALGSVVPGAGTVLGFGAGLVGGMVGYAVATGAYATAVETVTGGVDVLADKAKAAADSVANAYSAVGAGVGAALSGAALGSVVPGAGMALGLGAGLAGGMAGYAVATGEYATVLENAEILKDKALEMGQSVIDVVASSAPEALDDVRNAMNDFAASLGVPIHL